MRIGARLVWIIGCCFMLVACASVRVQEELQVGKIQFQDGNFKGAFRRLMPLAVEGNREAQYAIGYLYYYGYGVPADSESAIFWLKRSAAKHDADAIKALRLIDKQPPVPVSPVRVEERKPTTEVQNAMLRSDNKVDDVKPIADHYTLQLFGSQQLMDLTFLQQHLPLDNACHVATSQKHGKKWYVLTYGKYSIADDARFARDHLPPTVKALKPWVRSTDDLRFIG